MIWVLKGRVHLCMYVRDMTSPNMVVFCRLGNAGQ